jgi:serine/threonine-protein kinase
MGVVHHAIDPNIGRPVAIKTIRWDEFATAEERDRLRDRLFREARSAGILSHPGIVTVYDVEERGEVAYIAMEFVNGPTLEHLLSSGEPLPPERVLQVLREAAAALDYAHRKGIVHRDIKPANVMITEAGAVKITDFGIAKISQSEQFTQTGAILGTPNYMSPEQVQGLTVDGRSDQFSLCVIAYEMLTGERPFAGEQLTTTVYKIVHEDPPATERLNPTLNARIDAALRKGLAKKPEARYISCTGFVTALEAACGTNKGWKALARGSVLAMPTLTQQSEAPATTAEVLPPRRRRTGPYIAALLFGLALGGAGWFAYDQHWFDALGGAAEQAQEPAAAPPPEQATAPVEKPSPLGPLVAPAPQDSAPAGGTQAQSAPATPPEQAGQVAPPAEEKAEPPTASPPPKRRGSQQVPVETTPPGARIVLDNREETACTAPCTLTVPPGRHIVSVTLEGHQTIQREINITDEPFEMPPLTLRSLGGTLMLSSEPSGAAIFVNGNRVPDTTPAQLRLAPGRYNIGVEKNSVRRTEEVEIKEGITRLRITLE